MALARFSADVDLPRQVQSVFVYLFFRTALL